MRPWANLVNRIDGAISSECCSSPDSWLLDKKMPTLDREHRNETSPKDDEWRCPSQGLLSGLED